MNKREVSKLVFDNTDSIEQAVAHIEQEMLPELHDAVAASLQKFCEYNDLLSIIGEDFDDEFRLYDPNWAMDKKKKAYLYIEFTSIEGDGGVEPESWLGNFYGYAGSGMSLELQSDYLSGPELKRLVNSKLDFIEQICTAGFKLDRENGILYYPVKFNRTVLSEAFLNGEFAEALVPFDDALSAVHGVWGELDLMIRSIKKRR